MDRPGSPARRLCPLLGKLKGNIMKKLRKNRALCLTLETVKQLDFALLKGVEAGTHDTRPTQNAVRPCGTTK
jgi:hypothetical protein